MNYQINNESQIEVVEQSKNPTVDTSIKNEQQVEVEVQTEKSEVEKLTYNEPQIVDKQQSENPTMEKPIYSEPQIVVGEEIRKPAFAVFNRSVNLKNVAIIQEKIKLKGYRIGEPIQVIKSEEALKQGITKLLDINKVEIPLEKIKSYYLILDGQHRTLAVSLNNDLARENNWNEILIPAIEVPLINGETVTEYCNEINITKKEWSREDYVKGASGVHQNDVLLKRYNDLIKSEENPDGFSLSTLNLIFVGGKGLTKRDLELLCSGVKKKGEDVLIDIVPDCNIELGNWFIETCKEKGFKQSEIRKRYLIEEFNKIAINKKMPEKAKKVFESITPDDISTMTTKRGKLLPAMVIEHFKIILKRN